MTREELLATLRERYHQQLVGYRERGHTHREAFCVMSYAGEGTPTLRIWNSRDGVTPFSIGPGEEDITAEMTHVNWEHDCIQLDRVPQVGDYIFIDCTPEQLIDDYERLVERWWDSEHPLREQFETREAALVGLLEHHYDGDIPPRLVRVTEELRVARGWDKRQPPWHQVAQAQADAARAARPEEPRRKKKAAR